MEIKNLAIAIVFILPQVILSQSSSFNVRDFDKIIISPHISAKLIEADHQSVEIVSSNIDLDKINIKVEGKTLRIYLDGAKTITRSKNVMRQNGHLKRSLYQGTMASVNINYKTLKTLSVRGEEDIVCVSPLDQEKFYLKIYGESDVVIKNLRLAYFDVTIYGEADLRVEDGTVDFQKYVSYGESNVEIRNIKNNSTHIRAYGESDYDISVSDQLKVTAFGEAEVSYFGNPVVHKGIVIGEARIRKVEESL